MFCVNRGSVRKTASFKERKKDKKYKCNAKCNSLIVNVNNSFQIKQQSFPFHFVNHFTDIFKDTF